jgi:hypothetical protein
MQGICHGGGVPAVARPFAGTGAGKRGVNARALTPKASKIAWRGRGKGGWGVAGISFFEMGYLQDFRSGMGGFMAAPLQVSVISILKYNRVIFLF